MLQLNRPPRKIVWLEALLIVLVFTTPIVAISFPSVILPGIHSMNATSLQTPTYAESSRATILGENNWTQWKLNPTQSPVSLNESTGELVLTGEFPASSVSSAFSISRSLVANLTTYPIMYMSIRVSQGASYGIRFYTSSTRGSVVSLWADTDALNHRPGIGQSENVQVNMVQLTELNTGKVFGSVNSVSLYVERGASSRPTNFSLQLAKFEFLDYPFIPAHSPGSYHAIYIGLSQLQQNPTLTLRSVQLRGHLNASKGAVFVPYFIQGLSVYPGLVNTIISAPIDVSTTITISVTNGKLFSDNLPTEATALVIIAASGTLTQLVVENISLNYYSRTAQTSSSPSQDRAIYVNDAFFLLLLPASVIVLVLGQLRKTKLTKTNA